MKVNGWHLLRLLAWLLAGAALGVALARSDACRTEDIAPITYVVDRHE